MYKLCVFFNLVSEISNILPESIPTIYPRKLYIYKHTANKHVSNTCNHFIFNISLCAFHNTVPHLVCL